jgi:hypothetical protein
MVKRSKSPRQEPCHQMIADRWATYDAVGDTAIKTPRKPRRSYDKRGKRVLVPRIAAET